LLPQPALNLFRDCTLGRRGHRTTSLTDCRNLPKLPVMRPSFTRVLMLPGIVWFGVILAASGPGQESSPNRAGNLIAALNADPSSFNRMVAAPSLANTLTGDLISADLVHINRATFELEPALAEHWDLDKDGRTYTLHLRRGIQYSDGNPFTADDVLFSLRVLAGPDSMLGDQVKVDGALPSSARIDDHTVRIQFPRTVGMGLRCLDSVPMLPARKLAQAFAGGKIATLWGPASAPQDIAGLGPFRLKEYRRGDRLVLERNPYYWKRDRFGHQLPYLDAITFHIIPDRNIEALRFQSGELDVVNVLNPENYAVLRRLQSERGFSVRDLGPGLVLDFLWFNLNPGKSASGVTFLDPEKRQLFEQANFRLAVSSALDRDGVVEFGSRRRPLEVEILTTRGSLVREKMVEVIKENLAAIGIRATPQPILPNELITRLLESFRYEAILFGFTPTDVVPDLQADFWVTTGKNHFWHPGQPQPLRSWEAEIDGQIGQLVRTLDPEARRRSFERVQELWAEYLPAVPVMAANVLTGWSNRVGNPQPSILAPHLLWNAEGLTKRTHPATGAASDGRN
jgi:peptide/nickel transport system substrate-binding protein